MTPPSQSSMDIHPWPQGHGFQGRSAWWEYVRGHDEPERLDFLLLAALFSSEVTTLLLNHNRDLLTMFEFSPATITMLLEIQAETLEEFAVELVKRQTPYFPTDT